MKLETPVSDTPLPLSTVISTDGFAGLVCNGNVVWSEGSAAMPVKLTLRDLERMTSVSPLGDWRVYLYASKYSREYQRQDRGWMLYFEDRGFGK